MPVEKFDQLLDKEFSQSPENPKLDSLELDVMRRITAIKNDQTISWYDKMFASFLIPQFQAASVVLALFLGIGTSPFMPNDSVVPNKLTLEEFSYNSPHLSLNLNKELK
tara:strand:- start:38257 stop:38583 length:327 start_codon:yes stop_codon:yes gene_type:complete